MKKTILITFSICLLFLSSNALATDYYVWGGVGDDANDGREMTPARAWATIAHADDNVSGGDTVYVKGTFMSQQKLDSTTFGNGTSWGNKVLYAPWEDANVNFTNPGSYLALQFENKRYVEFNGFFGSTRRFRVYNANGGIRVNADCNYLRLTGIITDPIGESQICCLSKLKILGNNIRYLYIYDNYFRVTGYGSGNNEGIYIGAYQKAEDGDYIYIYDNTFDLLTGSNEPQAVDFKNYNSSHVYFYNNTINSFLTDGYAPLAPSGVGGYIYDNIINISNQNVSDKNAFFYFGYNSGYTAANATWYIYRNTLIGGSGNEAAITVVNDWPDLKVNIYNNIIKNIDSTGGGYIIDLDRGGGNDIGTIKFYHNTFYNSSLQGILNSNNNNATFVFKNNIFETCDTYFLTKQRNHTVTWDGNCYYKSGATSSTNLWTWNGTLNNWDNLNNNTGQETNGIFGADPNLDSNGYLQSFLRVKVDVSSEMSSWPGYNLDIDGNIRIGTWDVGASQFLSSSRPSPPTGLRIK